MSAKQGETKEQKVVKRSVRIRRTTYDAIKELLEDVNAGTVTEFIDAALEFYVGYLRSGKSEEYLIKTISSVIDAKLGASEERTDGMLFKVAVEVAMQNRILAKVIRIGEGETEEIREKALEDVRRIWL